MGDAFSNWVNRRVDDVRDISRRIQAGETPIQQAIKEQRQVQQHHEHQVQVDRVELQSKGQIPKGRVDKNHLVFEGTGSTNHGSDKQQGSQRQRGGSDRPHNSEKPQAKAEKQQAGSQQHSTERPQARAEKAQAGSQQHGAERPQARAEKAQAGSQQHGAERPQARADKSQAGSQQHGAEKPQARVEKSQAGSQQHGAEKPQAPGRPVQATEHVAPRSRSFVEPIVEQVSMSGKEYLKRLTEAGAFDQVQKPGQQKGSFEQTRATRAADAHPQGNRPFEQQAPRSADGRAQSQYVEPRNLPEHVKKAQREAGKEHPATKEAQKEQIKKQDGPQKEQIKKQEPPQRAKDSTQNTVKEGNNSAPKSELRTWAGKTVGTGLGFLGITGGISEAKLGVDQIKNGQKLEGTLNVTAGVSDITSGTASVLYTWGKNAMGTVAAKAGGAGSILSGASEGIQGIRTNDQEKQFEGGLKVVLGVGMLQTASRVSPLSASAMAGWSGGRFISTHAGWGGENIDTKMTRLADSSMNKAANAELEKISRTNQQLFEKSQEVMNKDLGRIEAEGYTRKDVSEAIIGLREQVEATRNAGNSTEDLRNQIKSLTEIRGQLSR
ncbi:MAG: hypothetical protein K2X77_00695 [Candidatus Obscuribacterales bacterium]|nr:hypothetical protein [Candidatus Obscuribacterales bacterium]